MLVKIQFAFACNKCISKRPTDSINRTYKISWRFHSPSSIVIEWIGKNTGLWLFQHRCDISKFLEGLEKTHQIDWNKSYVRADVSRLREKQKAELKQAIEAGKDILA